MLFTEQLVKKFHSLYEVKESECWEWVGSCTTNGYGYFSITHYVKGVKRRYINAHRYSYLLYNNLQIEDISFEDKICHHCDNPYCVNPLHLYLGTNTDNLRDAEAKGLVKHVRGVEHGRSKLTEEQVIDIRSRNLNTRGAKARLAKELNIDSSTIGDILKRRKWKHLA